MSYTLENAEEFEQAYLQLAHLYVERGKFDLSQVNDDYKGTTGLSLGLCRRMVDGG